MEQLLYDVRALNASVKSIKVSIDESKTNIGLQLDTQRRLNQVIAPVAAAFQQPFNYGARPTARQIIN
ncbi:hypothetical protein EMCRGX_G031621 [Ephydatia muelleri]